MKLKTNEEFAQELMELRKEGLDCIGELKRLMGNGAPIDSKMALIINNMDTKVQRFTRQYDSLRMIH